VLHCIFARHPVAEKGKLIMAQGGTVESSFPADVELPADNVELPADADAENAAEAATEVRAREMGWKPLVEYRGPPGKWQPAADFIARGENILPIVRDQNRRLTERVGKLEGEISGLRSTSEEQLHIIKDLRDMGARANQAGYDRAMAEIKAKQRQAVEAGDTKAFDQLVEQAEALQESRPAAAAEPAARTANPAPRAPMAPAMTPTTRAFIAENPWFNADKLLSDTMVSFHNEVLNERNASQATLNADPALDRELLEEAKSRVEERYPERFGVPAAPREPAQPAPRLAARARAASVAQPTADPPAPRPGTVATTINSIQDPAERAQARAAFNRAKRHMADYTEAEYMALYTDPHGDVLSLPKPRSQPNGR
jgi:hypothetical protein